MTLQRLFEPRVGDPMRVAFFASGGPGNLQAAFDVEDREPRLLHVEVVVADRHGIPALELAASRKRPTIVRDFRRLAGPAGAPGYAAGREAVHDDILAALMRIERAGGYRCDLAVLAYRRIITGSLLRRFHDAAINQHPADLTVRDANGRRRYTGIEGLRVSIADGQRRTRTSTILAGPEVDGGEIICQGPSVVVEDRATPVDVHEALQKRHSDWPSLRFALRAIASGDVALSLDARHPDGRRIVVYRGAEMGYGGVDLDQA